MSRAKRGIWIGVTLAAAALTVAGGILLMQRFDPRTGKFVISIAPVIAILIAFVSGVWRKNP